MVLFEGTMVALRTAIGTWLGTAAVPFEAGKGGVARGQTLPMRNATDRYQKWMMQNALNVVVFDGN
jgi:hypothetical protein